MSTKIFHYEHLLQELPVHYLDDTPPSWQYRIEPGYSHPLGAIPDRDGVNFSVFADRATSLELLLFDHPDDLEPRLTIQLDPSTHKTFHFWHAYIRGLQSGKYYAYRINGWQDLYGHGDRYTQSKILIDPYARGTSDLLWNRIDACGLQDNLASSMRSVIVDSSAYDWEGDQPLKRPMNETIIYEMHVRGFTRSPSSHCLHPGTFGGVIEKIPHLQELGITAVELLPVFDFDQREVRGINPLTHEPLINYWGYDPVSFFAPEGSYCTTNDACQHINEFRDMVKALHRANIEVILDVVFNHTSEGNHQGPIISFKGFANSSYYLLSPADRQYYMDYSGCGNTLNCNHPVTEKFITDVLEYWVTEMHIDGFRFDEAVILTRDEAGFPVLHPPVVWQIELSEVLADTKLIAEAWDAAGLYEVGYFPGYRWGEWNGRYRDTVRSFIKGDHGYHEGKALVGRLADVIAGSADIFEANDLLPINSINFVTAHDGFTLNDLVSYNYKHNEANGEGNRDGNDENLSWNCGWEGRTENAEVEELRERQIRNFAAILMLSQGVPMFVAGDEMRRSQQGNNNAYCQDNEVSWLDWSLLAKHHGLFRFFKELIAFRKRHPLLQRRNFFSGQVNSRGLADISWHGCRMHHPGWYNPASRVLAFTLGGSNEGARADDTDIHVIINMEWEDLDFDLPPLAERHWYRVLDSALPPPHDIVEPGREIRMDSNLYLAKKHSVIVLISR